MSAGERAAMAVPGLHVRATAIGALEGAEAAVIATEWPEFRELDWGRARSVMAGATIVDGRRLLDPEAMRTLGFAYQRVGSPNAEAARSTR